MILKDITYREYIELSDRSDYDFAIKYAYLYIAEIDFFKIGDLTKKPFGIIKDIQHDLIKGINFLNQVEYLSKISGIELNVLSNSKLMDISTSCRYLVSSILTIIDTEKEMLSHSSSPEEEQAGLSRFDGLGIWLQIKALSGGDVTKVKNVLETDYETCFLELLSRKLNNEYEKDLNSIYKMKRRH